MASLRGSFDPPVLTWTRPDRLSPFAADCGRKLRVTLGLLADCSAADALAEFSDAGLIDVFTVFGSGPNGVRLEPAPDATGLGGAEASTSDGGRRSWLVPFEPWRTLCRQFAGDVDERGVNAFAVHDGGSHDLLATDDPALLRLATHERFRELNICEPLTAVKVMGVLLRHRRQFVVSYRSRCSFAEDPILFYSQAVEGLVPSLYRFPRVFGRADMAHALAAHDALGRATRALEACDAIGVEYFQPQGNHRRARILYHFDYLALLLAAFCDAVAVLVQRLLSLNVSGAGRSLWKEKFRDKAAQAGLTRLQQADCAPTFEALGILRNTIHEEPVRAVAWQRVGFAQRTFVHPPTARSQALRESIKAMAAEAEMRVETLPFTMVDPYAAGLALTRRVLRIGDELAREAIEKKHGPLPDAPDSPDSARIALLAGI